MLFILFGSFIYALGVNLFTIPNRLSEGGLLGITIVAHYLFHWSQGVVNFVLNIVLLLVGYKFFEKRAFIYTLISIAASSVCLFFIENISRILTHDTLLASVFAGLLVGAGVGFVFRSDGTTGGTSILASIANRFLGWSMGKAVLIMDIVVVAGSAFIIGLEKAMYTLLAVFV